MVIAERKVYMVACSAALLDFRSASNEHSGLLHPSDYEFCQLVGARIHREGHPGLLTRSVRRPDGENVAIFNPRRSLQSQAQLPADVSLEQRSDCGGEAAWGGVDQLGRGKFFLAVRATLMR